MTGYSKPIILANEEMAEGVYAASGAAGSGCYDVTARIHQRPETGRPDFRIQVDAQHHADHTKERQIFTIHFNAPVTYQSCNGNGATLISGNGTDTLVIQLGYHQNPNDNIGFGDLVVTSDNPGLAILGYSMTD